MAARDETHLSWPAVLAFACGGIPVGALTIAVAVHLPRYFASHLGMSLGAVGAAFALVRAIDIPLDPAIGIAMDRTRSRFGRFRPWMIVGAPLLMVSLFAMIHPPAGADVVWLTGWLLALYLGFSIVVLSHLAWAAGLATTYHQRSRLFGAITAVGVAGAAAAIVLPAAVGPLGFSDAQGVEAMVWFMIIATPLSVLAVTARTPERAPKAGELALRPKDYMTLLSRPDIRRLLVSDLCLAMGPGWMAALYLFFFKDVRGFSIAQANILLIVYILAGFAGAPAAAWLARRIGKHWTLLVVTSLYSLVLLTQFFDAGVMATLAPMFVAGAMAGGFQVMTRALAADIGDSARLDLGRESMGLIYALTSATTKVGLAASIFLTYRILERVGYDAREHAINTPHAIRGLELATLVGPVVFVMLGGAAFIGYRLTAERHADIRRQLDAG